MLRFAANLTTMFKELPFLDRFAAAADAGFRGVEFQFPYEFAASSIGKRLRASGLQNVLFNLPPGDWPGGERGIACLPGREPDFKTSVETGLAYAAELGTVRLHAMSGIVSGKFHRDTARATLIANCQYAAAKFADHGITLLVEAINQRDIPDYFVSQQAEAFSICEAVDAPNIKMQMDCYHIQIAEGDVTAKLRRYHSRCGHIQIAGVPERHEPDRGELNYTYLFGVLDEIGYEGWIGCEYNPAGSTLDGLEWLCRFL